MWKTTKYLKSVDVMDIFMCIIYEVHRYFISDEDAGVTVADALS